MNSFIWRNSLAFSSRTWGPPVPSDTRSASAQRRVQLTFKQALNIQDESDTTVPEDRSTGNPGYFLEDLSQSLDHYFLFANKVVHHQSKQLSIQLADHEDALLWICGARLQMEPLI